MKNVCAICDHPERIEIDKKLASGVSIASLARGYDVPVFSLRNHKQHHLTRQLLTHVDIQEKLRAGELLVEVDTCLSKAKDILTLAEDQKKPTLALAAIREIRSTVEFLIKLAIQMQELQLKREEVDIAAQGQVFIEKSMSPKEAMQVYQRLIKSTQAGGSMVFLPQKEAIENSYPDPADEEEAAPVAPVARQAGQRTRTKAPAAHEESIPHEESMNGPGILSWTPDIPAKGW